MSNLRFGSDADDDANDISARRTEFIDDVEFRW
jgi:hypothetical protein